MNYYDVPILFSYLNKKGNFKYSLGPQFSFLKSSEMVYLGEQGEFTENFDYNTKSVILVLLQISPSFLKIIMEIKICIFMRAIISERKIYFPLTLVRLKIRQVIFLSY